MKQTRRGFLGTFAAIAAAVAVTPAVKADAAPEQALAEKVLAHPEQYPEVMARARELLGEAATVETSAMPLPPTFEAMVADCRERFGCMLATTLSSLSAKASHLHMGQDGKVDYLETDGLIPSLARVDAWRRALHEQADPDRRAVPYIYPFSEEPWRLT